MCKLCDGYDFRKVGISYNDTAGAYTIGFLDVAGNFSDKNRFKFCPECGKLLTEWNFKSPAEKRYKINNVFYSPNNPIK